MRKLEPKTELQQDEDLSNQELVEDVSSAEIDAWIDRCAPDAGVSKVRLFDDIYRGMALAAKKTGRHETHTQGLIFYELKQCARLLSGAAGKIRKGRFLAPWQQEIRVQAFRVAAHRLALLETEMLKECPLGRLHDLNAFNRINREYFPEPANSKFTQNVGAAVAKDFLHASGNLLRARLDVIGSPFLNAYHFVLDEVHLPEKVRKKLAKKLHAFAEEATMSTYFNPGKFAAWYTIGEIIAGDASTRAVVSDEKLRHYFIVPLLAAFHVSAQECNLESRKFFDSWYNRTQNEMFPYYAPFFAAHINSYYDNEIGDDAARRIVGCWHEADESNSAESVRQNLNALNQLDEAGERFPNLARDLFGIVCPAQVGVSQIIEQINLFTNGNVGTGYGIELRSRHDWNGSFANRKDDRDELKKDTRMPIIVLEADDFDEAALLMQPIREKLGRASFLSSYSHGSKKCPAMDIEKSHRLSGFKEALQIIDDCLLPTAPVFLHWCEAGLPGGAAQELSSRMRGRRVIALREKSVFQEQKVRIVKGQPIITLKATQTADKVTIKNGRIYQRRRSMRPTKNRPSIVPKSRLPVSSL